MEKSERSCMQKEARGTDRQADRQNGTNCRQVKSGRGLGTHLLCTVSLPRGFDTRANHAVGSMDESGPGRGIEARC